MIFFSEGYEKTIENPLQRKEGHMLRKKIRLAILFLCVFLCGAAAGIAQAVPAPDANSVLILESTVTGGSSSVEAAQATALGLTPVVVDAATWAATTADEFATYRALILGDPTCSIDPSLIAAAEANRAVWGPKVNGNVIIVGSDPVYHQYLSGAVTLTNQAINFSAYEPSKTGAYISLSCYYSAAPSGTPVPLLDQLGGSFTVVGQGACPNDSHIVAVHPALSGLTDADLSYWGCSSHEGFVSWPAQFLVLAISKDIPSPYVAPDGTSGAPYIVARGSELSPILCGDGDIDPGEECDDGNTTNGDGCSAQCTIEPDVNDPPVCSAASASKMQLWPPNHKLTNVEIVGVTDPDGDAVTVTPTGIRQDEPVKANGGDKSPDAVINADGSVSIRVERDAKGDGRLYHIDFTAVDGKGGQCTGTVRTCVPHDQGQGNDCVDGGPIYDSLSN